MLWQFHRHEIAIVVGMISRQIHLVQQFSLRHLEHSHVSVTKKRSTPLSFINNNISQRLHAISLPFTDCALNEATMNGCKFCTYGSVIDIFSSVQDEHNYKIFF